MGWFSFTCCEDSTILYARKARPVAMGRLGEGAGTNDALPNSHPWRRQICHKLGLVQTCQNAKHGE